MCSSSIVMPTQYEMLVSHSPPVYNHSYLTEYASLAYGRDAFSRIPRGSCRNAPRSLSFNTKISPIEMPVSPRRPCLVIRAEETHSSSDEDPTSPTRLKKKVVFADDRGMSLTHVRIMTEPSNVPPLLSSRFLSEVTQGLTAEPATKDEPWEITFPQPASDYVDFRRRLDTGRVSLENVIVKDAEEVVVGTVKVSNISFEKEVIVRWSSDNWKTHEDLFCKYIPNSNSSAVSPAYVLYDTFSFRLTFPPKSRLIEFCVCFQCNSHEYWDNNNGKNYILIKKLQPVFHKSHSSDDIMDLKSRQNTNDSDRMKIQPLSKCIDAMQVKVESWADFASWTHLENSNPYCFTQLP